MAERSAASPLSVLDPHRIAFRGWSGSAQMVSWLMNLAAKKRLPGITIAAGVMMAGGSHACYNWPGHGARNNCQHCNATQGEAAYHHDPRALGCSSTAQQRGLAQPYCE